MAVESMSDLQPGKQIVDVGERKVDTLGSGSGARVIGAVLRHRYFNADNTRVSELQAHDVRGEQLACARRAAERPPPRSPGLWML